MAGYDTLLVDSDSANPSVGFHLGLENVNIGYKNYILGKIQLRNACVVHAPSGLHVLPGTINSKPFLITREQQKRAYSALRNTDYKFIVVDTEPGYGDPISGVDKALLVTTPDMPSCSSIIRLSKQFDSMKIKHDLVVNRVRDRKYEIHPREIAHMYDRRIIGILPEFELVPISIEEQIPAVLLDSKNRFSSTLKKISTEYTIGTESSSEPEYYRRGKNPIIAFFSRLFKRRRAA